MNDDTKELINMIFARFHHIYTHRFESAYRDETMLNQAKREWALSLQGIAANQMEHALEACKLKHAWPPTIAEFLALVEPEPEILGLPTLAAAYQEACQHCHQPAGHSWSHLCVQLAAQQTGYRLLQLEPERVSQPRFASSYKALMARLMRGETVEVEAPEPPLADYDDQAERDLVDQLTGQKVSPSLAAQVSYYLEKPIGSDVRKHYRQRAMELLRGGGFAVSLPE